MQDRFGAQLRGCSAALDPHADAELRAPRADQGSAALEVPVDVVSASGASRASGASAASGPVAAGAQMPSTLPSVPSGLENVCRTPRGARQNDPASASTGSSVP